MPFKKRGRRMGQIWNAENVAIDTFGIQEFFVTHMMLESAGDDLIRCVRCVERNGVLQPVFSYVSPVASIRRNSPIFVRFVEGLHGHH